MNRDSLNGEIEFRKLVELLPEIVARTDNRLDLTFINKYGMKITGYSAKDIKKGLNLFEVIKEEEKNRAQKNIKKILKDQRIGLNEYTIVKKDGSGLQVLANSNVIEDEDGNFSGLSIVAMDLTEKKKTEKKLNEEEQKYRLLAENVNDIIFVQDMDLNIKYASPSAARIFGYEMSDINGIKMQDLLTKDSLKKAVASFKKYVKLAETDPETDIPLMKYEYIKKDRSTFWGEMKVRFLRDPEGRLTGCQGILRDISERKKAEDRLKYLSFHDSLTGLYSRAYFDEELKRLDTERQLPLSIIIGDVNGLKLVNDTLGHSTGDLYLYRIARIIEQNCRREDIVTRWGGDEFAIILPRTRNEISYKIIERINRVAEKERINRIPLSISFGTAVKDRPGIDISLVIQSAEYNMYNNKLVDKKSLSSSIISALERTLWEKSHETQEHAHRIKRLAVRLGESVGLYQNSIDELILLSSLHDIGKIAISEGILNKNGSLSDDEWEKMRKHPEIGYNICVSSPQLAIIARAVLAHHEWWDGSGYPQGIKGENIPVTARIMAIADSYDVMIKGRDYREPLTVDKAVAELKKFSGTQFDPGLVRNFIKILGEANQA